MCRTETAPQRDHGAVQDLKPSKETGKQLILLADKRSLVQCSAGTGVCRAEATPHPICLLTKRRWCSNGLESSPRLTNCAPNSVKTVSAQPGFALNLFRSLPKKIRKQLILLADKQSVGAVQALESAEQKRQRIQSAQHDMQQQQLLRGNQGGPSMFRRFVKSITPDHGASLEAAVTTLKGEVSRKRKEKEKSML